MNHDRPGSEGEHTLQERFGTLKRAAAFYDKQMLDHLNPLMREYLARQEMMFVSTADANGECDASFRAGPPGFVRVLDDYTVMYPEYRGNGVMASLGNISENGHVGLLFVDFFHTGVGLHINGRARIVEHEAVEAFAPMLERVAGVEQLHPPTDDKKKAPSRWILVDIVEAYIHCSKHIPILAQVPGVAGHAPPSGDHFKAKDEERAWTAAAAAAEVQRADAQEREQRVAEPVLAEPAQAAPALAEPVAAERVLHEPRVAEPVLALGGVMAAVAAYENGGDDEPGVRTVSAQDLRAQAARLQAQADELELVLPPAWTQPASR